MVTRHICDFLFCLFNYISSLCLVVIVDLTPDSMYSPVTYLNLLFSVSTEMPLALLGFGSITDDPLIFYLKRDMLSCTV